MKEPAMRTLTTHTEGETWALGQRLGAVLRAGDVVLLTGELGAGKSVLARGIARGMGVTGPLPSPTFTLMAQHIGARCPLYHMDLYRLADEEEFFAAGLEEYAGGDGVAVIEWPERAMDALPERRLAITMHAINDGQARQIRVCPQGGFPEDILTGLEENA